MVVKIEPGAEGEASSGDDIACDDLGNIFDLRSAYKGGPRTMLTLACTVGVMLLSTTARMMAYSSIHRKINGNMFAEGQ